MMTKDEDDRIPTTSFGRRFDACVLGDLDKPILMWKGDGTAALCIRVWWRRMDQDRTNDTGFHKLLDRLRAGDEEAAKELIDRFGDAVRREIRFRLRDSRLFRVVGESDLFQSAVSRFVWGLQLGKFDVDNPAELLGLLRTIAERRVCAVARFWRAQRRDLRRNEELGGSLANTLVAADQTPSNVLSEKELIAEAFSRLPDAVCQVLSWRQDGCTWAQIAEQLDGPDTPEAIRKQYERAIAQVAVELGWDEN